MTGTQSAEGNPQAGRPVAAALLAGGLAKRMGGDKAGALVGGVPLAVHGTNALRQAGLDPFIVTRADRPFAVEGVPVVTKEHGPRHPLAGVAEAIRRAGGRDVIVLACDLPLLPAAFLAWLAARPDGAAMPQPGGRAQPLAARYSPENLTAIESLLERRMPTRQAVEAIRPYLIEDEVLRAFGDPDRMFFNVNSPEDLRRAERLLATG